MYESFFCERLSKLRNHKGVSARDMSLSIGQSESYINTIENKKAFPSMTAFFTICDYFGITPKEFFDDGTVNPPLFNELSDKLRGMDDKVLQHILGLINELEAKK